MDLDIAAHYASLGLQFGAGQSCGDAHVLVATAVNGHETLRLEIGGGPAV